MPFNQRSSIKHGSYEEVILLIGRIDALRYVALAASVAFACGQQTDLDAERAAIMSVDSAWLAAAQARDVEATLDFWTEDARVIAPGEPPYIGHDAIRGMLTRGFNTRGFAITWRTSDVVVAPSGDVAYSFGTNAVIVPNPNGGLDTLKGQGVVLWRKNAAGRWRSAVDIWNPSP
jgi:uncharacterized protein (TIGR02246 family)